MTNTIKTIIVDDEINSIHNLEEDLKAYPEIEILDTITSSQKAKKSIIQYQPDLLFLDVEMPYINGIELLQEIRPYVRNNMRVIFYSAFDKYMLDALRASAFDYLLKPYQTNIIRKTKRFAIPKRAVYFLKTKRTAGGTPPPQNIFDRLTPVFT